jgi:hypothetical protein
VSQYWRRDGALKDNKEIDHPSACSNSMSPRHRFNRTVLPLAQYYAGHVLDGKVK